MRYCHNCHRSRRKAFLLQQLRMHLRVKLCPRLHINPTRGTDLLTMRLARLEHAASGSSRSAATFCSPARCRTWRADFVLLSVWMVFYIRQLINAPTASSPDAGCSGLGTLLYGWMRVHRWGRRNEGAQALAGGQCGTAEAFRINAEEIGSRTFRKMRKG